MSFTPRLIPFSRDLPIRNIQSLPHGSGAPYLECIEGPNGELIAKSWRRKIPARYAVIVQFP